MLRVDMRALYPEPPGAGFGRATFWVYRGNFEPGPCPWLPHHRWPAGYRYRLHASLFCY
eukprot:SAG25_NODE_11341_length_306_cov_1.483092_1_plen_58_part_01